MFIDTRRSWDGAGYSDRIRRSANEAVSLALNDYAREIGSGFEVDDKLLVFLEFRIDEALRCAVEVAEG